MSDDVVQLTCEVRTADAEDVVAVLREWHVEPIQRVKPGHAHCWIEAYFDDVAQAELLSCVLRSRDDVLASMTKPLGAQDWTTFWRHHFKTIDVGLTLRIVPSWEEQHAKHSNRTVVVIDPGMSFGTGDHFTTRFCLEKLERVAGEAPGSTLLDVGTGSGILAITGARLGFREILAMDSDERALESSSKNAELNDCADSIEWLCEDLHLVGTLPTRQVLCANLFSDILMESASVLVRAAENVLILSGIRENQGDAVSEVFQAHGCRQIACDSDGEWLGLMMEANQ